MMLPESRRNKESNYFLERDKHKRFALATQLQREARVQAAFQHRKPIPQALDLLPQRSRARRPTLRKSLKALTVQLFLFEQALVSPEALPLAEFLAVSVPMGKRCLLALSHEGVLMISRKDYCVAILSSMCQEDYSVLDCVYDPERGFVVLDVLVWQQTVLLHQSAEKRLELAHEIARQGVNVAGIRLTTAEVYPGPNFVDYGSGVIFYHRQGLYQMNIARTIFKWKNRDSSCRLREFAVLRVVDRTDLVTFEGKLVCKLPPGELLAANCLVKFSVANGQGEYLGKAPGFSRADTYAKVVLHYCLNQRSEMLPPEAASVLSPTVDLDLDPEEQASDLEKLSSFNRNLPYIHMTQQDSA